jgi:hypothetical protein
MREEQKVQEIFDLKKSIIKTLAVLFIFYWLVVSYVLLTTGSLSPIAMKMLPFMLIITFVIMIMLFRDMIRR